MELVNGIYKFLEKPRENKGELNLLKGAIEVVIKLLFPFVPHITEELWEMLGGDAASLRDSWIEHIEEYTIEDKVVIAVQVNGKLRDTFEIARDAQQEIIKDTALGLEKVQKHIEGRPVKKVVVIPNKLVNIVC